MIAHTIMYCTKTLRRLFCIPCASISLARTIALANEATWNIVHAEEPKGVYFAGQLVCYGPTNTAQWMKEKRLMLPPEFSANAAQPLAVSVAPAQATGRTLYEKHN